MWTRFQHQKHDGHLWSVWLSLVQGFGFLIFHISWNNRPMYTRALYYIGVSRLSSCSFWNLPFTSLIKAAITCLLSRWFESKRLLQSTWTALLTRLKNPYNKTKFMGGWKGRGAISCVVNIPLLKMHYIACLCRFMCFDVDFFFLCL